MGLTGRLTGEMEVELTSADLESAFDAICGIMGIRKIKRIGPLNCRFVVGRKDYIQLYRLCTRRGDLLKVRGKRGIYWTLIRAGKRPVLTAGIFLLAALVCFLPTRVLFVQVEGNTRIPDREILAAAEECGVGFWASRREVRSERTKNALLSRIEALQWAGINTTGCVAVISVRERSVPEAEKPKGEVASVVAMRDGYILSCTPIRGTALVQPGQSVIAGQVLISGYTDCGLSIRATRAEGEVQAVTSRVFEAVMPKEYLEYGDTLSVKRKLSLLIRKKRINLWKDSGIWEGSCGRMYEEYYITLPGGHQLPFALCVETYTRYQTGSSSLSEQEAQEELTVFAERMLQQQMVGGKILTAVQRILPEPDCYRLTGTYSCSEMIGKLRQEKIGDTNGKIS